MLYEKIPLSATDAEIYLECYVAEKVGNYVRSAMLVIPGGGYGCICSEREGEPIAQAFIPKGYNAFVLHYSVGKKALFPQPLVEAMRAVKHIKNNSEKYNINPERVFVTGFSAGGHLAAALGTMWHEKDICGMAETTPEISRPTGMLSVYPVISGSKIGHMDSFYNILGTTDPSTDELKKYSLELRVNEKTVPAFIAHTANDNLVDVRNSLVLANALAENKIPFEMHIFPDAPHGMALGNEITAGDCEKHNNPVLASWVDMAAVWMKSIK